MSVKITNFELLESLQSCEASELKTFKKYIKEAEGVF